MNTEFDKWKLFYNDAYSKGVANVWPNDVLVRIMRGRYIPGIKDMQMKDKKIVEVGFGSGNNLRFFGTLGMILHGIEVHDEICITTKKMLNNIGFDADLKCGDNKNISFPDNYFDFLVSWDVLHYEGEEKKIKLAIEEYARVLKKGGRFFLSTVAPKHTILRNSELIGPHQYKIGRSDDFRKEQIFFYFDRKEYIHYYFSNKFTNILVGRSTVNLFAEINDTFFATGEKK